jgi:hypothetical protein
MYQRATADEKALLLKKNFAFDELLCYYSKAEDKFIYSEDKAKFMKYNHNLVNHIYSDGLLIQGEYAQAGYDTQDSDFYRDDEGIVLKKITTVGFRELLQLYIELRKDGTNETMIVRYEMENPLFKPAYDQLGESGIKTCTWMERKIKERVIATSPETIMLICNEFFNQVGNEKFISKAKAKVILQDIYKKFQITGVTPSLSVLKGSRWYTITPTKKRVDGKDTNGIILKQIRSELTLSRRMKKK